MRQLSSFVSSVFLPKTLVSAVGLAENADHNALYPCAGTGYSRILRQVQLLIFFIRNVLP